MSVLPPELNKFYEREKWDATKRHHYKLMGIFAIFFFGVVIGWILALRWAGVTP